MRKLPRYTFILSNNYKDNLAFAVAMLDAGFDVAITHGQDQLNEAVTAITEEMSPDWKIITKMRDPEFGKIALDFPSKTITYGDVQREFARALVNLHPDFYPWSWLRRMEFEELGEETILTIDIGSGEQIDYIADRIGEEVCTIILGDLGAVKQPRLGKIIWLALNEQDKRLAQLHRELSGGRNEGA